MKQQSQKVKDYIEKEQRLALKGVYGDDYLKKFKKPSRDNLFKFLDAYVNFKIKNEKAREKLKEEIINSYQNIPDDSTPYESSEHKGILNAAKDHFLKVNPGFPEEKIPHLATLYSHDICAEVSMEIGEPVMFFYGELFIASLLFSKIFILSIPYEIDESSEIQFKFGKEQVTKEALKNVNKIKDLMLHTIHASPHNSDSYPVKDNLRESFVCQLLESIYLFVFSHEVGHCELKHTFGCADKEINWKEEYEADIYAANNIIKNYGGPDRYGMYLMGPVVFFHYIALLETDVEAVEGTDEHPPAMQRLNKYLFYLRDNLSAKDMAIIDRYILGFADIFQIFYAVYKEATKPKPKPVKQHDLPATYLRRFAIDPESVSHKRMIWCYRNEYNKHFIEEKSVHASLFKSLDFYTIPHDENPYAIEEFFSKEIEPRYQDIMYEISNETNLTLKCRQDLMIFLHFNKLRNRNKRAHLQKMIDTSIMVDFVPKFGVSKFNEVRETVLSAAEQKAKEIQINSFADQDLLTQLDKAFGVKHWLILKSRPEMPFISNDNPGFSININEDKADFKTLSNSFATNGDATNYFILSPQYCLVISPFYQGTPLETSIHNQEIEFLRSGTAHIGFINFCTIQTHSKYVISNNENSLKRVKEFFVNKEKKNV